MARILVIDDDPQLVRALRINLKAGGHEVTAAVDARSGLALAAREPFDLLVLDLGLPDLDGVEVVTGLRGWSPIPIIVLSARDGEPAKIAALDAGADDYVTKPFHMGELHARIRSALRRSLPGPSGASSPAAVTAGELTVDLGDRRVRRGGVEVRLTPTEWALLEMLVRHAGRPVQHRQLLETVWGPGYVDQTNYLRVHLANLRRKIERDPAHPTHIVTEPHFGYRFVSG